MFFRAYVEGSILLVTGQIPTWQSSADNDLRFANNALFVPVMKGKIEQKIIPLSWNSLIQLDEPDTRHNSSRVNYWVILLISSSP